VTKSKRLQRGTRALDPYTLDEMQFFVRASHQMRAFETVFDIGLPYRRDWRATVLMSG